MAKNKTKDDRKTQVTKMSDTEEVPIPDVDDVAAELGRVNNRLDAILDRLDRIERHVLPDRPDLSGLAERQRMREAQQRGKNA